MHFNDNVISNDRISFVFIDFNNNKNIDALIIIISYKKVHYW